jgi:hypothetical protein
VVKAQERPGSSVGKLKVALEKFPDPSNVRSAKLFRRHERLGVSIDAADHTFNLGVLAVGVLGQRRAGVGNQT